MAYTKQTWACGDEITAEKLNHMEEGIAQGGGVLVVINYTDDDGATINKSYSEIKSALEGGEIVNAAIYVNGYLLLHSTGIEISDNATEDIWFHVYNNGYGYISLSPDGTIRVDLPQ